MSGVRWPKPKRSAMTDRKTVAGAYAKIDSH